MAVKFRASGNAAHVAHERYTSISKRSCGMFLDAHGKFPSDFVRLAMFRCVYVSVSVRVEFKSR